MHLYHEYHICMRTTLNIPDQLIKAAKRRALEEGRTLTDLLVEGLRGRLARNLPAKALPVSAAAGGLLPGVDWNLLEPVDQVGESYR
jgi:hypothetical protein